MTHTPQPGTILTIDGRQVKTGLAALEGPGGLTYPLTARCAGCGGTCVCMDGTADWAHLDDPGFARYYDNWVTTHAGNVSFYVRRTRFEPCRFGDRVATCYHVPRCRLVRGVFGHWREGWTGPVRSASRILREADAWRSASHDMPWQVDIRPAYPETRLTVRAWQRAADKAHGRLAGDRL